MSYERGEKKAFGEDEFWKIEKGFGRGLGEKRIGPRIELCDKDTGEVCEMVCMKMS